MRVYLATARHLGSASLYAHLPLLYLYSLRSTTASGAEYQLGSWANGQTLIGTGSTRTNGAQAASSSRDAGPSWSDCNLNARGSARPVQRAALYLNFDFYVCTCKPVQQHNACAAAEAETAT